MKNMAHVEINKENILEMAKNGWDAIISLYKNSTPEERKLILKILGGILGLSALLEYLKKL